jgi:hypothetical protein
MTTEEALQFLAQHQPLPPDDDLSDQLIATYDAVRRHFIAYPDSRCIGLFLHSFGNGSGFGVYQVVDDVFRKYSTSQLTPHLIRALQSQHWGVRYWASQWAMEFPSVDLIPALQGLLLSNASKDQECRFFAVAALEQLLALGFSDRVIPVLRTAVTTVSEPEARGLIGELLERGPSGTV